jgi:hypothetical protein
LCVAGSDTEGEREGRGWAWSRIIGKSLALYKSFNTAGVAVSYLVSGVLMEGSYWLPKKQAIPMKASNQIAAGAISRECFYPSARSGSTLRTKFLF